VGIDDAGMARRRLLSSTASGITSAALPPMNWMSMGAGVPKLRVWLTWSAGWKKNSTPGSAPAAGPAGG
jgi:hypothetical protein